MAPSPPTAPRDRLNGYKQVVICATVGFIVGSLTTSTLSITSSSLGLEMEKELEATKRQLGLTLSELKRLKSGLEEEVDRARAESKRLESELAQSQKGGAVFEERDPSFEVVADDNSIMEENIDRRASIVEEVMPQSLLPTYAPEKLPFNVTRSMLRQSRPIVGNTERLHLYLRKLRTGQCTKVLYMGGSVTHGRAAGGSTYAYPHLFVDWLNTRYPCAVNGTAGSHVREMTRARDSVGHFTFWSSVSNLDTFDLVFLEFNINDGSVGGLSHALESKNPGGGRQEYVQSFYFEILLRRLLLLKKPDPVAIVTFNVDYDGRKWARNKAEENRKTLFRHNEPQKLWVSSIYEIPVFSSVVWMIPLSRKKGTNWQFDSTNNIYSTSAFHSDDCCHPKRPGHLMLSLILAYCIHQEEQTMMLQLKSDMSPGEHDFTMDAAPILPDPLYLSPDEEELYVKSNVEYGGYDFTDPQKQWEENGAIVASDGWTWGADNEEGDKYGYIADNVEGGPHLAIMLTGERFGKVEVSYVQSYENFGVALAWIDDSNENIHGKCIMNGEFTKQTPEVADVLWAQGGAEVSVPMTELLTRFSLKKGEKRVVHLCLAPRLPNRTDGNKFKLVGVRVY